MSLKRVKCDPCETTFNSEEELSVHIESAHKKLSPPEKEGGIVSNCELQLTPTHVQRDEERLSEQECPSLPAPVRTSPPTSANCLRSVEEAPSALIFGAENMDWPCVENHSRMKMI